MTVHVITTAFCNARVFVSGMASLRRTVDFKSLGAHHHILDNHYPLNPGATRNAMEAYAAEHGDVSIIDVGRNLGLHEGVNLLLDRLTLADDDIVIGYDADEDPQNQGWVEAMARVFAADPRVGWLSLMAKVLWEALDQTAVKVEKVGGERVRFPNSPLMNCVVAWRGSMLKAVGKMAEPHAFYGGLEAWMQPKARHAGFRIGWMCDYWTLSHRAMADATYERYKLHHVGHEQPLFPGSFDEWIKVNP